MSNRCLNSARMKSKGSTFFSSHKRRWLQLVRNLRPDTKTVILFLVQDGSIILGLSLNPKLNSKKPQLMTLSREVLHSDSRHHTQLSSILGSASTWLVSTATNGLWGLWMMCVKTKMMQKSSSCIQTVRQRHLNDRKGKTNSMHYTRISFAKLMFLLRRLGEHITSSIKTKFTKNLWL